VLLLIFAGKRSAGDTGDAPKPKATKEIKPKIKGSKEI
jgi:hypothetical protein